jgi:hypothetical protein
MIIYLSTKSCFDHCYHPFLKADAISRGLSDMEQGDIKLMSLYFSVDATPVQISQMMECLKGLELGTVIPNQIYIMNQKTEQLQELAL